MSRQIRPGGPYVAPTKSDDTAAAAAGTRGKYTLENGSTYYYDLGGKNASLHSVHIEWDAAIILTTVNVEDSNVAENEAPLTSVVDGEWVREDPSTAYISVTASDGSTGGATVTSSTIAVAGGTAGGAMVHLGNAGAARTRLKVVVAGTGGVVRVSAHGKD